MNTSVFNQWLEANRAALAPALRWQELAADTAQKLVQHNLAVSRDFLEYGDRQWRLLGEVKEPQKWAAEGSKNAAEFGQKVVERTADFFRLTREAQDAAATWTDQATKAATESFTAKPV